MKRKIAAGIVTLAAVVGVGWKLAGHAQTSLQLHDVSLVEHSERSQQGPTELLAGIRIRLMPSDFDEAMTARPESVPKIAIAAR